MPVYLATKTLEAIEAALSRDQGAVFRDFQRQVLPMSGDAYSTDTFPFRTHLGASLIGDACARKIWYGFRWTKIHKHDARTLRLFNRGHLEEARIISALLAAGIQVYQHDENGKQFRISGCGGHFGGSGDGIATGVPDLPNPAEGCVLEFKTHNDASFKKLVKDGVKETKPLHYVQTNTYMRKMRYNYTLYIAVNKNNDEYYAEILVVEPHVGDQAEDRAQKIIWMKTPPEKLPNASKGFFDCKWCDYRKQCFDSEPAESKNCRNCEHVSIEDNGVWRCSLSGVEKDKFEQLAGCTQYKGVF